LHARSDDVPGEFPVNRKTQPLGTVGTASSRGKEAVVGTARPPIRNPRSAVPCIAATRASGGGRTERRLDDGYREYAHRHRRAYRPPTATSHGRTA